MRRLYFKYFLYRNRVPIAAKIIIILIACFVLIYNTLLNHSLDCSEKCPYTVNLNQNRLVFDHRHYLVHYPEFICPQNFRNLADWIYGWPDGVFNEKIEIVTNGSEIAPCLPYGSIIFVKTDFLENFFLYIYPYLVNHFVLISGQGDASSPGMYLFYLHHSDSKIIHWFGQNSDIEFSQSKKFTPIPIGKSSNLILV